MLVGVMASLSLSNMSCVSVYCDDALARENRKRVHELVVVGQDLGVAEELLKNAGFELMFEEAITPTVAKDYLSQFVIVGKTTPNIFDSVAYAAQVPWIPFNHKESPYVVIDARLDGEIFDIE